MLSIFADSFGGGFPSQILSGAEIALAAHFNGKAGSLIVSIQRFDEAPSVAEKRRIRKLTPAEIEKVRTEIYNTLNTGIRLPRVAAAVALSASQFSRAYHATTGETFSTHVLRIRLETAMRLLASTDLPLYEVAIESGFGDQSNFSRAFAKSAGVSPFKWRLLAAERAATERDPKTTKEVRQRI
jgi:transcriptional regulator GlxA family with amidase domain